MNSSAKPLVIYHKNCLDGFASAYLFYRLYRDSMEYLAADYTDEPPDVTGKDVYIVDFSYNKQKTYNMTQQAHSVTVIDHHKTAVEELSDIPKLKYTFHHAMDSSGCMLVHNYLSPGVVPHPLLMHIEDRDLWKFRLTYTKEVCSYLYFHDMAFKTWDRLFTEPLENMIDKGAMLLKQHDRQCTKYMNTMRYLDIAEYEVPVVNVPGDFSSEIGNRYSKDYPFAATYFDTKEYRIFSLRSSKENPNYVDVSAIAKLFGGGGHVNAAGFHVQRAHPLATA